MKNINLPHNDKQKFQIGDVCQIIRGDEDLMSDKLAYDEVQSWYENREVIILHSYAQVFWGSNYFEYAIMFLDDGSFLAWRDNNQLGYIREPTEEEKQIIIDYDKKEVEKGKFYNSIFSKEDHSAIRWDAYFQ